MATSDELKKLLSTQTVSIKSKTAALAALEAQRKKIKKPTGKAATKKALAAYEARLSAFDARLRTEKASLNSLKAKQVSTQNKYYQSTGQYEQLLKGTERDAYLAVSALFKTYGLESLAGKIFDYVKNGYSGDTISILLQDTKEYKTRFAGNEARKAAGLPVLSAGEYLATEASYRQIMQSAGLPIGFYDQPSDFSSWIGKNVSPSEIQTRVDLATQATTLANPAYRKALNQMGISDNELTAYFLDQARALPHIQKAAATAAVGAEALKQGLTFDKTYAEQLATSGISAEEAQQGYSQIASSLDTFRALGSIYGEEYNQRTAEQATFEGSGSAIGKQRRLLSAERGAFGGASGGSRAGLSQAGGSR